MFGKHMLMGLNQFLKMNCRGGLPPPTSLSSYITSYLFLLMVKGIVNGECMPEIKYITLNF